MHRLREVIPAWHRAVRTIRTLYLLVVLIE